MLTAARDGNVSEKLVELFVIADSKQQVSVHVCKREMRR